MRQSFTAVLERNQTYGQDFATEPYEAAWAGEARWFVRVLELAGRDVSLMCWPEISPDGLHWCAEGSAPLVLREAGLASLALREFGHWLRLRCEVRGDSPSAKVMIALALKQ